MILSLLLAGMGTVATAQNINLPIIRASSTIRARAIASA